MKVMVTLLRSKGRRLSRKELAPPLEGRLVVSDLAVPNILNRWVRKAEVLANKYGQFESNVVQPMFDPQLMRVDGAGMILQGVEIHAVEGDKTITEHVQVWLCTPVGQSPAEQTSTAAET